MADTLRLLFELDTDPDRAIANFKRARVEFAREIQAIRKLLTQPFQFPAVRTPALPSAASAGERGRQVGDQLLRDALRDTARLERERLKIVAENEKAIEGLAKREADARIREGKRAANTLLATLRDLQREETRSRASIAQRASGSTSSLLVGTAGGVAALVGVSAANEIRQAASAWLDYSSKLETTRIAFTTMLGSSQAAEAHLKELQRFALTTPFQFTELIDASQRMQALGFSAEQVIPVLTNVGDAVAGAGGGSERLDRVVLALSQIQSKGKVATQELNQLAEAGIPAFRILSEALGKSTAEVRELVEQGQVSSKVFLDAFQKFSQANFGGLMEKQARTFTGALSNIKDALLQTSATAFEPLFKKISEITDRIARELQNGQPTLESVTRAITTGLIEIIATAGAQAGQGFIESTARKIGDPSAWKQLLKNVSGVSILEPALRGLFSIDPEDLFGLGDVSDQIGAIKIPDLSVPLRSLKNQQNEVSESSKKAGEIVKDLTSKLVFYGQTTERAATLQKLLAIGTDAVASAEGRRALQLASLIDKQRIINEMNEAQRKLIADLATVTEGKYKNAFESLLQAQQDAVLGTLELNAVERDGLTALERFNFGLGSQIQGLISQGQAAGFSKDQIALLATGLVNARNAMIALTAAQEDNKRRAERKRLTEERTALLRSLAGVNVDLTRQLRGTPSDEVQRLAQQLEGLSTLKIQPGGLDLFVEKLRSGSIDAQQAIAEISTAIINASGDLGDGFDATVKKIVNLFLKAKQLADASRDVAGTINDLNTQIAAVNRDIEATAIRRLIQSFGNRREILRRQLALQQADLEAHHAQRLQEIDRDKRRELDGFTGTEAEKLAIQKKFNELRAAEERRFNAEHQANQEEFERTLDPLGPLKDRWDQFREAVQNANDSIADSVQSVAARIAESFDAMVDATRQGIVAWILYGESLGAALKKALAVQLANLAAEFAIQAIRHAAFALGSLAFGDFGGAAKHAAAAAAFTAAAAATGFAGRALAKSSGLFKGNQSSTAAGAVNGGGEASPRNANFNFGGPGIESSSRAAQDGSSGPRGFFGSVVEEINRVRQEFADRETMIMRELGERENERTRESAERERLMRAVVERNTQTFSQFGVEGHGVVVKKGAGEASAEIAGAVVTHSNQDYDFNERMIRNFNLG